MNMSNSVKNTRSTSLIILLLVLAIPVAVVAGYFYRSSSAVQEEATARSGETIKNMWLKPPIVGGNRLAEGFVDADGDLVADAPETVGQIDPPKIIFSYIADEDAEASKAAWQAFADHLSKAVGKSVEIVSFNETMDQLKALRDSQLHITGLNSGSVPIAVNAAGFVPVGLVPGVEGNGITHTEIIVQADSPIQSLADIRGKTMTYTSPTSNSGFKAPILALMEKVELHPGEDYNIVYSQGHEQSIKQIAGKQSEVAAVASDMLKLAVDGGDIKSGDYRVIYTSESFPSGCIGYSHKLKPELAQKIKAAVLAFDWKGTPLEKQMVSAKTQFVPANYKDQFSLLRRIDDVTGTKHEIR
jgi:phosphonate transport system substrate-binding protein